MMEEFLKKDFEALETLATIRSENLVEYTLDAFLRKVEDKKEVIDALFQSSTKRSEYERGVMEFITKYIAELVAGKMTVTEYIEKCKSKQMVYVYLGTHWDVVDGQLYYVFVKRCAKRLGLDEIYCEDQDFMNKVFERLAFRVMDYKKQKVTPGEVWVNLSNGTLEIKKDASLVLREHRPEDFFTYMLPYPYNPAAECVKWHKFLDRVLPEKEMQTVLAEYIGYCFTRNLKLEKMAVFYGTGSNGKSVLMDIITKLLGSENVSFVTLSALTCDDEKRSQIEGKLANISHESNGELDTAMLKQIVSGEPTEVRVLYRGTHVMRDIPKLFTSYNRLPSAEYTYGFFRRWKLFPFRVTIPDEEQDVELTKKLCEELSGILNWVLEALGGLMQRKAFSSSPTCEQALQEYISNSNSVMQFFSAMCEVDENCYMKLTELYGAYSKYCMEEDLRKFGKKNFQEVIASIWVKFKLIKKNKFYFVKFKNDFDDD